MKNFEFENYKISNCYLKNCNLVKCCFHTVPRNKLIDTELVMFYEGAFLSPYYSSSLGIFLMFRIVFEVVGSIIKKVLSSEKKAVLFFFLPQISIMAKIVSDDDDL